MLAGCMQQQQQHTRKKASVFYFSASFRHLRRTHDVCLVFRRHMAAALALFADCMPEKHLCLVRALSDFLDARGMPRPASVPGKPSQLAACHYQFPGPPIGQPSRSSRLVVAAAPRRPRFLQPLSTIISIILPFRPRRPPAQRLSWLCPFSRYQPEQGLPFIMAALRLPSPLLCLCFFCCLLVLFFCSACHAAPCPQSPISLSRPGPVPPDSPPPRLPPPPRPKQEQHRSAWPLPPPYVPDLVTHHHPRPSSRYYTPETHLSSSSSASGQALPRPTAAAAAGSPTRSIQKPAPAAAAAPADRCCCCCCCWPLCLSCLHTRRHQLLLHLSPQRIRPPPPPPLPRPSASPIAAARAESVPGLVPSDPGLARSGLDPFLIIRPSCTFVTLITSLSFV